MVSAWYVYKVRKCFVQIVLQFCWAVARQVVCNVARPPRWVIFGAASVKTNSQDTEHVRKLLFYLRWHNFTWSEKQQMPPCAAQYSLDRAMRDGWVGRSVTVHHGLHFHIFHKVTWIRFNLALQCIRQVRGCRYSSVGKGTAQWNRGRREEKERKAGNDRFSTA